MIQDLMSGVNCQKRVDSETCVYNIVVMMTRFLQYTISVSLLVACLILSDGLCRTNNWKYLTTAPIDTAEAQRLRLWLPLERPARCRTLIDIFDLHGQPVRRMVDQLMDQGYYNFYWDKLDDSGYFVEPGDYRWRAISCRDTVLGELTALYHRWERSSRVEVIDSVGSARFLIELDIDSAQVTATILNHRGRHISDLVQDTLLSKGQHYLSWEPPSGYAGRFIVVVSVGGFEHRQVFLYKRALR